MFILWLYDKNVIFPSYILLSFDLTPFPLSSNLQHLLSIFTHSWRCCFSLPWENWSHRQRTFPILLSSQIHVYQHHIQMLCHLVPKWTVHAHTESYVLPFSLSQGCSISLSSPTSPAFPLLLDHSIQRADMLLFYQSLKTTTTSTTTTAKSF